MNAIIRRKALANWHSALLALGFLVVLAFESWQIATPGLWQDEASTISGASRGPLGLLALSTTVDAVHSLYYLVLGAWGSVFGFSPFSVRFVSALAVSLAVAATYLLGRRLGGVRLGLTAATLLAILPRMTWAATEARSYGITALLGVTLMWLFLNKRWGWGFAIASALASYFFIYAVLLLAAGALALALRRETRDSLRQYLRWSLVSLGLSSVVLVFSVFQRGQISWIEPTTWGNLSNQLVDAVFPHAYLMARWLGILLALALAVLWLRRAQRVQFLDDLAGFNLQYLIVVVLLPFTLLVAASLGGASLYNPRYVTFLMPAIALLVGWVLVRALPRTGVVAALLVLASLSLPVHAAQREPLAKGTDWGLLAQQLTPALKPNDGILFAGAQLDAPWLRRVRIAYLEDFRGTRDLTERNPYYDEYLLMPTRLWPRQILDNLRREDRVWLVTSNTKPQLDGSIENNWLRRAGLVPQPGSSPAPALPSSSFELWVRK